MYVRVLVHAFCLLRVRAYLKLCECDLKRASTNANFTRCGGQVERADCFRWFVPVFLSSFLCAVFTSAAARRGVLALTLRHTLFNRLLDE